MMHSSHSSGWVPLQEALAGSEAEGLLAVEAGVCYGRSLQGAPRYFLSKPSYRGPAEARLQSPPSQGKGEAEKKTKPPPFGVKRPSDQASGVREEDRRQSGAGGNPPKASATPPRPKGVPTTALTPAELLGGAPSSCPADELLPGSVGAYRVSTLSRNRTPLQ